jgi:hypothetical protein
MFVLRGRWATNQTVQIKETADASDGSDVARARNNYATGDETFNLQTTDKMIFLVTDLWQPSSSGAFGFSFGGYSTDFPVNTEIQIDWAAAVAL